MADASIRSQPTRLAKLDPATLDATLAGLLPQGEHAPSSTISARPTARFSKSSASLGPIRRLGYELGEELGRGGMGAVHAAVQEAFDRPVAIKRVLAQEDRGAALKFYAEAVITGALEHPNIVPVYDLLGDDAGRLQLVMKRVSGRTWKALLHPPAGTPAMPLDEHLDILVKVCEAVSFAHANGILHRDLKPENVMVGEHGEVLVMDWGCAVAFGETERHPVVPRIEEVDCIAGTPAYMAPEMVLVESKAQGPHSDVYLLGAILYEVLTGTRVHRGDSLLGVLRSVIMDEVEAPAVRAPERDPPGELADICLAALAREPADRTASADVFLRQLRSYRGHAEAVELAQGAERLLARSATTGRERGHAAIDDRLRQAVAAAENAVQLWPDWPTGTALAARATLAHATHSLATGGFTQAESLAQRSLRYAKGDEASMAAARTLVGTAQAQGRAAKRRDRTLRLTRWATAGLAALIAAISVVAVVVVNGERAGAESARLAAEKALAGLHDEQVQRAEDQRRFAPGLLAMAKAALSSDRFDAAADSLAGALAFDPTLIEALALQANVLAASQRYPEALVVARRWSAKDPGSTAAGELVRICATAATQKVEVVQAACADLFIRQHLPSLAQRSLRNPAQRLLAYQARIDQAWPEYRTKLVLTAEGLVEFEWNKELAGQKLLVDLSPLRGIPFKSLRLHETGVHDLAPLADMPLQKLDLSRTAVRDVSVLRSCPLVDLSVDAMPHLDFASAAGLRLRRFGALDNPRLTDIGFLKDMPLEDVNLANTGVSDLSALRGKALRWCRISGPASRLSDLAPLRGAPLVDLAVEGSLADLTALAGAPLRTLSVLSRTPLDLAGVAGCALDTFKLAGGTALSDPSQLARITTKSLVLQGYEGDKRIDLRHLDPSRIVEFFVDRCDPRCLDLAPLAPAPLQTLHLHTGGDWDLSPLAHVPLASIDIGWMHDVTWAKLAVFRSVSSLRDVTISGKRRAAADFWRVYEPQSNQCPGSSTEATLAAQAVIPGPLRPAIQVGALLPGLDCQLYTGSWASVVEMRASTPVASTNVTAIDLSVLPQKTNAGLRLSGLLSVPRDGPWVFTMFADDGAVLAIDGIEVVGIDGLHAVVKGIGTIPLRTGAHRFDLAYFNGEKDGVLRLSLAGPELPEAAVPAAWFGRERR